MSYNTVVDPVSDLLGQTLHERYVVTGVLGSGGQGETLEAVDKKEGRSIAIKRFRVKGASSWKDVELAEREAEVLMGVEHRLLPRAFDRFEEDGALYLAMDKIDGENLAGKKLGRREVIDFLSDAAEVLGYLHTRVPPIIHRDVKPANFVRRPNLAGRDSFVLVDFGSVRARLEDRGGSTVVGTFGYMAPEQLQGRALPATDVYAVGVTALNLLTGVEPEDLPHRGLTIDVAAALGQLVAAGDPLVPLLAQMVEPDPDKRPARIAPLLAALEAAPAPAPSPGRPRDPRRDSRRDPRSEGNRTRSDRRDARRAKRESRRADRDRVYADRDRVRVERWRQWQSSGGLPPIVRFFAILVLIMWRVQVAIGLGVIVPVMLTLLSLVFGPSLRRAAERVRHAGRVADDWLDDATRRVRGSGPPKGVRIDADPDPEQKAGAPVRIDDPIRDAVAEAEQAFDETVTQVEDDLRRKSKR